MRAPSGIGALLSGRVAVGVSGGSASTPPSVASSVSGGANASKKVRTSLQDIVQDFEDTTIYPSRGANSGVSRAMLEAGKDTRDVDASLTYSSTVPEFYKTFGSLKFSDTNDIDLAEWLIYTDTKFVLSGRFWTHTNANLTATVYETMPERNPPEIVVLIQEPKKAKPHGD